MKYTIFILLSLVLQANSQKINYEKLFIEYINEDGGKNLDKLDIALNQFDKFTNMREQMNEEFYYVLTKKDIKNKNFPEKNNRIIKKEVKKIKRITGKNPEIAIIYIYEDYISSIYLYENFLYERNIISQKKFKKIGHFNEILIGCDDCDRYGWSEEGFNKYLYTATVFNKIPDFSPGSTNVFAVLLTNFVFERLVDNMTLDTFLKTQFKYDINDFDNNVNTVKKKINELDSIFIKDLKNDINTFLDDFDTVEESIYYDCSSSRAKDCMVSKLLQMNNPGYAEEILAKNICCDTKYKTWSVKHKRYAQTELKKTINAKWGEIKSHYGGVEGLKNASISKRDIDKFTLTYSINKLEINRSMNNQPIVSMLIDVKTSKFGKDFYGLNSKNSQIDVDGKIELLDNPFLYDKINNPLPLFKCTFPDNELGLDTLTLSLEDFKKVVNDPFNFINSFKNDYELYWNEVSDIIDSNIKYVHISPLNHITINLLKP